MQGFRAIDWQNAKFPGSGVETPYPSDVERPALHTGENGHNSGALTVRNRLRLLAAT